MTPSVQPQLGLRQGLLRLWSKLSRRRRFQLLAVAGLMLASSLAEMLSLGAVMPFLGVLAEPQRLWASPAVQGLVGFTGWKRPADLVLPMGMAFAAAALLAGVVRLLTLRASISLANAIGSDLSIEVYRRTLYQPYAVHLRRNSSETISAASNEVGAVVGMLNSLLQLATSGLVTLGLAGLLLLLNPAVTLAVGAVVGGGYAMAMAMGRSQLQELGPAILADQAQLIRSLQEGLGAIRDVILDGSQPTYTAIYASADRRLRRHQGIGQFLAVAPRYAMEAVGLIAIVVASLRLMVSPAGFLGAFPTLGALALGAQRLLPALQLIYANWGTFRLNLPALVSVLSSLELPIAPEDLIPAPSPWPFQRELRLDGVSFRYGPELPWVLRDVQLTIHRGERIGIAGETGSGKSTLVDLLMGLLEPTSGQVLVDGVSLDGPHLRRWRAAVGHVPQSIFLADTSIAENIAFGIAAVDIDVDRLHRAAEQARIAAFIDTLPRSYATPVGERGVRLSGGQCQRIGIARALYRQTPVLVFDEATSALDHSTETEVMEAINGLSSDLTLVMIAHRLSTLRGCDRVIRVSCTHVVEETLAER